MTASSKNEEVARPMASTLSAVLAVCPSSRPLNHVPAAVSILRSGTNHRSATAM